MNAIGHKQYRPQTLGHKINHNSAIGHKFMPKSHVSGSVKPTPTGEIVNYSNDKNQVYEPYKGDYNIGNKKHSNVEKNI